jgi:hypothetical protein
VVRRLVRLGHFLRSLTPNTKPHVTNIAHSLVRQYFPTNMYKSIFDIPTPPTPTNSPGLFQLLRQPTSLPDDYTPTRSPMTKRLLKMSGSGLYGRSPICTPFPIATPNPRQSSPTLAIENESLREKKHKG